MRGDIVVLNFFRENRPEHVSEDAFKMAVARADLYTAKWIATYYPEYADTKALVGAALRNGWTDDILATNFQLAK
ncbi:hypothetical protein DVH05_020818 [Phytophthora capsici]|nr:hypothetical protein DVH05_020818 [Phytophthora capsici]